MSAVIIDSGGANITSLRAALARLGAESLVTTDHETIRRAPRVLLPCVGSAHDAMSRLRIAGLDQLIPQLKQPLLGICLGMQLLFERSEEGPPPELHRHRAPSIVLSPASARRSRSPSRVSVRLSSWAAATRMAFFVVSMPRTRSWVRSTRSFRSTCTSAAVRRIPAENVEERGMASSRV